MSLEEVFEEESSTGCEDIISIVGVFNVIAGSSVDEGGMIGINGDNSTAELRVSDFAIAVSVVSFEEQLYILKGGEHTNVCKTSLELVLVDVAETISVKYLKSIIGIEIKLKGQYLLCIL